MNYYTSWSYGQHQHQQYQEQNIQTYSQTTSIYSGAAASFGAAPPAFPTVHPCHGRPHPAITQNGYESDFTLVHKELVPTEPVQHDPLLDAPRLAPIALPTIASDESQVLDNLEATQRRMHKRLQHIPAANIFIMKLTPISPPKIRSKRMPKANASPTVTGPTQRKTKTTTKATTKTPMTAKMPAAPIAHRQQELPRAPLLLQAAQPSQQKSPLQPQPQPIALSLPQLTYANLMAHRAALGMHQAAESAAATRKRKASNLDDDHIAKRAKTSGSVASAVQAQPLHSIELTRSYTGSTTSSSTLHTRSTTVGGSSSPSDDELFDEFIKPDTFF
ncbi:hypothetical protein BKA62DRAFT_756397 [Auriculariales sp. MPI-PUGE-AT-0066]|nr:hypothetical protein BKA62DRAFT_756397 [Auriculariales sp. MPI-PUGE-AT-0066]